MSILLTGGSGFLAVIVAQRLLAQGVDPASIVLTDLVRHDRLAEFPDSVTFIQADLTDTAKIQNSLPKKPRPCTISRRWFLAALRRISHLAWQQTFWPRC